MLPTSCILNWFDDALKLSISEADSGAEPLVNQDSKYSVKDGGSSSSHRYRW